MDPKVIQEFIATLGVPLATLLVVLYTGYKGKWVFGRENDANKLRGDKWEQLFLDQRELSKESADLTAEVTHIVTEQLRHHAWDGVERRGNPERGHGPRGSK